MVNTERQIAKSLGLKTYISDRACQHCGSFEKYVSNYSCVECILRKSRANLENPELMSKYRTKDKLKKKQDSWRQRNPEKYEEQWLRRTCNTYGITVEQFKSMLDEQGNVCKICRNECTRGRLSVDHDHTTGTVRGLLCRKCNLGLGNFQDNVQYLSRAMEYLIG